MKQFIQTLLKALAKLYLWRYKPQIVAITGNVGKTSTKEAIGAVLSKIKRIRMNGGNMNNEWGIPVTILGDWSGRYYDEGAGLWFYLMVLFKGLFGLIYQTEYPEVLVLEYGADKPGDIKRLARSFRPHIGVVTAVGEVPVHVEFFAGPEALAREKSRLLEGLTPSDFAVLNFDDLAVLEMKERTKGRVMTYGFGQGADIKISNFQFTIFNDRPEGVSFKLENSGSFVPVKLDDCLGKSQAYAAAAAAAVGLAFGMNIVDISEALSSYLAPAGRLRLLSGIKNSLIIDDTYNASPASTHLALETLRDLPGKRKIAILGNMLELGKYSIEAHKEIGNMAGSVADILMVVGDKALLIADSAENEMSKENIFWFEKSTVAGIKAKELIREGDLVLVKGSQGVRMEKVVEEIMAEPARARELLVRQSKTWLNK